MATLEATAEAVSPATLKVTRLLGELETYVCGQSDIIIDYATARRREEPISTAVTESTVQWLVHRRMSAQAADVLDATRRTFDAQGSMRGNERFPPARSRRRRRARLPSVSSRGITPRFWTVSDPDAWRREHRSPRRTHCRRSASRLSERSPRPEAAKLGPPSPYARPSGPRSHAPHDIHCRRNREPVVSAS
jgi:hypothetical protein